MARLRAILSAYEQMVRAVRDADEDDGKEAFQRADELMEVRDERGPPRNRGDLLQDPTSPFYEGLRGGVAGVAMVEVCRNW